MLLVRGLGLGLGLNNFVAPQKAKITATVYFICGYTVLKHEGTQKLKDR